MKYNFRGSLRARLAGDFEEPLAGVSVLLYPIQERNESTIRREVATPTKRSFGIVSNGAVPDVDPIAIDEETDPDGRFAVEMGETDYFSEDERGRPAAFRVDVRVRTVPGVDTEVEPPVQFTLGYHQPDWRRSDEDLATERWVADWDPTITKRNWCAVLEEAGVWSVCGRVTICETTEPVGEVTVTAKDADIVEHDTLGSAVTDSDGRFCIYYTQSDFEETPPPWGPLELVPGPDLYFTIERSNTTLLDEDPGEGRKGNRENAGHCEYADLCVDPGPGPEPGPEDTLTPPPTDWRRIGSAFEVPGDFDADGYAGNRKYALYRDITLEGSAPLLYSESPDQYVQYRVQVSENPTSNGPNASNPSGFTTVGLGAGKYSAAFVENVTVGDVYAYDPTEQVIKPIEVQINSGHLTNAGWLSVRDAVDDALSAALGTDLQTLRANDHYFGWNDSDPLMGIDTREFTTEADVTDATASGDPVPEAGDPVPPSRRIGVESIAIKFEARVVDDSGAQPQSQPTSVKDTTLNAVVINNNDEFAKLVNVNHQQQNDECKRLSGRVELGYTVHHPHLDGVRLVVKRNDGTREALDDPNNEVSFGGSFVPNEVVSNPARDLADIRQFSDSALTILRPADTTPNRDDGPILTESCGYAARLHVRRRLHDGDVRDDWDTQGESIFYWETGSP